MLVIEFQCKYSLLQDKSRIFKYTLTKMDKILSDRYQKTNLEYSTNNKNRKNSIEIIENYNLSK